MKTIAYLRISTDKQDEASQRQIISEHVARTGQQITAYATDQASGALPWQQRALSFALRDCVAGDAIIVSEISRIARSTVGVLTFLQAAAEKQVSIVAVRSGITLDGSSASKIVVTVLAMAAEIERDMLRERTRAALAAKKARGEKVGRQAGATGKNNKLKGKEVEVRTLLEKDVSKTAMAKVLGVSRGTLYAFLESLPTEEGK
jgi:DNA invertase Pin-like site-specific DNA recombinase